LTIVPSNIELELPVGTPLKNVLHEYGVEFPCGARGTCHGCRVRVVQGNWEPDAASRSILSSEELATGYRLACMAVIASDVTVYIEQWQTPVLSDHVSFNFNPQEGYGIAVDIGTTTIVAQLIDRKSGSVLATKNCLNPQIRYGTDLISRVHFAVHEDGLQPLSTLIRSMLKALVDSLLLTLPSNSIVHQILLAGNTVMHHLFCGISPNALSIYPFESNETGMIRFAPTEFGWSRKQVVEIVFLPCIGGFIGSDLLVGILATGMHQSDQWVALVDLGTNGEIVIGNRNHIYAASTAAGPAFEGGSISVGMRAENGAVYKVTSHEKNFVCETIGGTTARGICGSGLVDAVAEGLNQNMIDSNGRICLPNKELPLCESLYLIQKDIRQVQLAKSAIAVGVEILLTTLDLSNEDIKAVYLAGAFGNYIAIESAQRIGLLNFAHDRIISAGNTSLRGTKMALHLDEKWMPEILQITKHISLSTHAEFQEKYISHMHFPVY
jgi:uncharacterized 2Fe-2S/4Fe-4S cluster protein (DUF4445 family)